MDYEEEMRQRANANTAFLLDIITKDEYANRLLELQQISRERVNAKTNEDETRSV